MTIIQIVNCLREHGLFVESNLKDSEQIQILNITDHSQRVSPQTLFFCKGVHFCADYLESALQNGAVCYITERIDLLGKGIYILVSDIRRSMAVVANLFYDEPWRKLTMIAITGTKGKSTTAYMIKSILDTYVSPQTNQVGLLSSIENFDGEIVQESHLTTLEPLDLHRALNSMVKNGCKYCIMEVSSQALKYDRVYGIEFDLGLFLNIGEDHISAIEHSSFEDYFASKQKLIPLCKNMLVSDTIPISKSSFYTVGSAPDSDYCINGTVQNGTPVLSINDSPEMQLSIPGSFNITNAGFAAAAAIVLGVPLQSIQAGLQNVHVSGRMEVFFSTQSDLISIVDYAHNKLSYETLFQSISHDYPNRRIIAVFGCPGGKAFKRRKELPEIAERYADMIVLTEEDSGEEPLEAILQEISSHIQDKSKLFLEPDREKAIQRALSAFHEPSIVLILGKGRETRQKRGTEYVTTESDVTMLLKYL